MGAGPRVVIVNRGSIVLPPGDPWSVPLPGSEVVVLNLARALAERGVPVCYVGAHRGSVVPGVVFRPVDDLAAVADGPEVRVVWLRDYAAPEHTFARLPRARHYLLTQDSSDDLRALTRWPVERIRERLVAIAEAATGVVFASEWHRRDWRDRLGVDVPRGRVIHNLAAHVPWRPTPADAPPHRIVHTSHPRKALAAVAAVAARLVPDGFQVTCLSDPALYQESACRVVRPGASGPVNLGSFADFAAGHAAVLSFRPPVASARIGDLLDGHRILLHPDYSGEVGATTVLEALRRGLIPVVSDLGALPELVGDAGVVVPGPSWSDDFADRCAERLRRLREADCAELERARRALSSRYGDAALLAHWSDLLEIRLRPGER